jgi:hypothetical protein
VMRMIIYVHLVMRLMPYVVFTGIGGFRGLASNCRGVYSLTL